MRKPLWQQKIARERIGILLKLAKKEFHKHPERSKRYIELARKISLRYNIRLKKLKRIFCKNCNTLIIPSLTSSVRLESKKKTLTIKCLKCNKIYRYKYKR
jgi:ribonuclease P protein subunit RPR2